MTPELPDYLRSISDQLAAFVAAGVTPNLHEVARVARELKAVARSCEAPPLHSAAVAPLSPAFLRNQAVRLQVLATLIGMGQTPEPATLRMIGIHLYDAADTIDELRAHAGRTARLRVVG